MTGADDPRNIMRSFIHLLLVLFWIPTVANRRNQTQREVVCKENEEYQHGDICCLNCPAGTYVTQACSRASRRSDCRACDFDTFTEHSNGLEMCLRCTKCRSDQELVERCINTNNTECRCKPGFYCLPNQPCEVCKTCSKCKEDEEEAENCKATSNTVCRKRNPTGVTKGEIAAAVVSVFVLLILVAIGSFLYWRSTTGCKRAVNLSWLRGIMKPCAESSSSSNFVRTMQNDPSGAPEDGLQRGTGNDPMASSHSSDACSNQLLQQHYTQENEKLPRLVPVNGEESLKKSFDLFGDIDIQYCNRFFRHIGLSDNAIRSTDASPAGDRMYELLKVWMEKEGMKADFNDLIDALWFLGQRMSAENISNNAVTRGYFTLED